MLTDVDDETLEATALIATVERLWGRTCRDCGQPYRGPDVVYSIALGFKDAPRCLACLSVGLKRDPQELQSQLHQYIQRRECYRQAWAYANQRLGEGEGDHSSDEPQSVLADVNAGSDRSPLAEAAVWDAGDMSCGDLVMALRIRLMGMSPKSLLKIIAYDPAAPEDLPSWCRLTGHALVEMKHPEYLIRRKEN